MPAPDFGPLDRAQGWVMTAVITALAALTRFLNLGSPTDAGSPIFDEKHYAPQAWQMLGNHGVEDNPGYGLVVHPPVGKQLIAVGEAGVLDVDPAEAGGLDDARLGQLDGVGLGRAGLVGSAQARAREGRQVRHRLGGSLRRVGGILAGGA
jgi:hypothetical protein